MRERAHGLAVVLGAAALLAGAAGCGGGDHAASGHGGTDATRTMTAAAGPAKVATVAQPTGTRADAATTAAVKAVGERYLHAMAAEDGAAVCATQAPKERRDMALLGGGSCAKAYRRLFATAPPEKPAGAVVDVRLRGPYAVATWAADGHRFSGDRALVAQRVGGRWLLVHHEFEPSLAPSQEASARAIRAVANRFLRALAAKDWKTACATRTPQDRRQLADYSGARCEDALEVLARQTYGARSMRAGRVTFDTADAATVAVLEGHDTTSVESLKARLIGSAWLLEEDPDNSYTLP